MNLQRTRERGHHFHSSLIQSQTTKLFLQNSFVGLAYENLVSAFQLVVIINNCFYSSWLLYNHNLMQHIQCLTYTFCMLMPFYSCFQAGHSHLCQNSKLEYFSLHLPFLLVLCHLFQSLLVSIRYPLGQGQFRTLPLND